MPNNTNSPAETRDQEPLQSRTFTALVVGFWDYMHVGLCSNKGGSDRTWSYVYTQVRRVLPVSVARAQIARMDGVTSCCLTRASGLLSGSRFLSCAFHFDSF